MGTFALHQHHIRSSQIQIVHIESVCDGIEVRAKINHLREDQRSGIMDGLQDSSSEVHCKLHQECMKNLQCQLQCVTLIISHVDVPTVPARKEGQEMEMAKKKSVSGRGSVPPPHPVNSDSEDFGAHNAYTIQF